MDEPRAQELMHDINLLRRAVRRRLRAGAAQPALSLAQIEVLQAIEEQPGTGVSAVARALRLAD
ncbi:MAG TPA: MarR family transcriptional regulator, partial [Rugosimonospora sp.]|nr:MarR family transcriptional regulator [Rugosimonospora sp.]